MAAIQDGPTVHFGESEKHKAAYLLRHKARETWTMKGVESAGFWARWMLWNKPSIAQNIASTSAIIVLIKLLNIIIRIATTPSPFITSGITRATGRLGA